VKTSRRISFVDTHTAGEPTRLILDGFPTPLGSTMEAKRRWLSENADWLRNLVLREPRGHRGMFGAILTNATDKDCQTGVIFMDGGGYLRMCGHGSIGVATALVSIGAFSGPGLLLDTPAGVVSCHIHSGSFGLEAVTVRNVPSFYVGEVTAERTTASLAYSGNLFALVDAGPMGLRLGLSATEDLVQLALKLRSALNQIGPWHHPASGEPMYVELIEFYEENPIPRNVVVFGKGQVDRSPCGTGLCAKMAFLHAAGRLSIGAEYPYRSILGTEFVGMIVRETRVGTMRAIVPEFTGTAYISSLGSLVVEEGDPFPEGFELSPTRLV